MNFISLLIGIRFPVLIKMMARNGFSICPKFIPRLVVLLLNSILSSFFAVIENLKYSRHIRDTVIAQPPVFIIGHWRTGSTFLHQLLNLDPQFTTPITVQTVIPDHFLFSSGYYIPLMKLFTNMGRPMDDVQVLPMEPQEDEFALIRMGSESPLEKLFFPSGDTYFLLDYDEYIPRGKDLVKWKQNLLTFYKKITFQTGKQIVSKNPYHTLRMSLLAEMFPGARFIHICRSPYEVVPSTIKMWDMMARSNSLKQSWKKPDIGEVSAVLRSFADYVSQERKTCGKHQFSEVLFEKLEQDPINELKRIYRELNLDYSVQFEKEAIKFLNATKGYKKNEYKLSENEKTIILSNLGTSVPGMP
jgi:hypothetical protein